MHRYNCMHECYAKLKLAKKIKEESMVEPYLNPNQVLGQTKLQVVYSKATQLVAPPNQQDAPPQGKDHPVAPLLQPEQARIRRQLWNWEEMWRQLCQTNEAPLPSGHVAQENQQQQTNQFAWKSNRRIKQELRRHIADNVRSGLYQLKPLLHKQCGICRSINITYFSEHVEWCQAVTYTFGCPCGYLCSSSKSLGGHSRSCDIAKEIKHQGDYGWIPYISHDLRLKLLPQTFN